MESLQKKILVVGVLAVCFCVVYVPRTRESRTPSGVTIRAVNYHFIWSEADSVVYPGDPASEIDVARMAIPILVVVLLTVTGIVVAKGVKDPLAPNDSALKH